MVKESEVTLRERGRALMESPALPLAADLVVVAAATTATLAVAGRSLPGAVALLAAVGVYATVGFDRLYHRASQRWRLGPAADVVLRTVGYAGGAVGFLWALGTVGEAGIGPLGAFAAVLPGNSPLASAAAGAAGSLPVGLVLALAGAALLVEGGILLLRRLVVARSETHVGGETPLGRIVFTGIVHAVGEDDPRRTAADGGQQDADPFEDTPFESAATVADLQRDPLTRYAEDDPVVVDPQGEVVVARGRHCDREAWREQFVEWLAWSFHEEHGVDLRQRPEALARLREVADRTRRDLAERTETDVVLPFIADVGDGDAHLRRTVETVPPGDGECRPPFVAAELDPVDPASDDESGRSTTSESDSRPAPEAAASAAPADSAVDSETAGHDADAADAESTRLVANPRSRDRSVDYADGRTLPAPLSGRDCVAYDARGRSDRPRTVGVGPATTTLTVRRLAGFRRDAVPFEVESFDATALVDPDDVTVYGGQDATRTGADFGYETAVEPGDSVTVVGPLVEAGDDGLRVGRGGFDTPMVATWDVEELEGRLTRGGVGRLALGGGLVAAGVAVSSLLTPVTTLLGFAAGAGLLQGIRTGAVPDPRGPAAVVREALLLARARLAALRN
jgi:hypothetical protein